MKKKHLLTLAAAAAAALFCMLPVKADAAELIRSDEYGEVLVVDVPGGEGLLFMGNTSDKVMQFLKESAGDPYFVRYNVMDATLAKVKATASSILVFNEEGELTGVKGPAEIGQDIAAHQAMIEALNQMDPQQQAALENQQLVSLAAQQKELEGAREEALEQAGQAAAAGNEAEAAQYQFAAVLCEQLLAVANAKQQAVLLYQQQAAAEAGQVLLSIQELAGVIQQEIADYSLQYQQAMTQAVMTELFQSML